MGTSKINERKINVALRTDMCLKYPMSFDGRKAEYTILKHIYIYNEYKKIRDEVTSRFPELADYLPQKYYYMIVSQRFSLTENYVCALINRIKRRGNEVFKDAEAAKQKILEDEYRRDLKRKRHTSFRK